MKPRRTRRAALALFAAFGIGVVVVAVIATQQFHLSAARAFGQLLAGDPARVFGKDGLRVLVVGLDYDYDERDQETSAHSRSDIIMAVNLDFTNRRIFDLSVPRDMVATLPNGRVAKINEAQSDGGIRESEDVVSRWLGVPAFDRYVILRIDTMKDLIDALGGVEVDVKNSDALMHAGPNGPVDYDDSWGHLHVHLRPGMQHLDGGQAVGYARFRHDWCSDPCRIMRQQQVIHALVNRIEDHRLDAVLHLRQLVDVMRRDVETNLSAGEEFSLAAAYARVTAADIVTGQVPYVRSVYLPGSGDSVVADEDKKRALVATMLADAPPAPPDAALLSSIAPAAIRVHVQNGTNVKGLARRIAERLRDDGFTLGAVDNAGESDIEQSTISGGSAAAPLAFKVQQALGDAARSARVYYTSSDANSAAGDVLFVVGGDVARALERPAAAPSP
jgi:LCP family protein required for cell wall assembly